MDHKAESPVAIITGAGSGIGREISIGLAEHGYRVVIVGRRLKTLEETGKSLGDQGTSWLAINADVTLASDRARILSESIERFGSIHTIVNNAGLGTCHKLGDLSETQIADLFAVNTIGPIELVRIALPELIKSKGCVVNIASMAIVDPFVGLGVYGCTKAAIDGLTRAIHNEYNEDGVRAYTIAPGAVETEMLRSIVSREDLPTKLTLSPDQIAKRVIDCIVGQASEPSGSTILMNSP